MKYSATVLLVILLAASPISASGQSVSRDGDPAQHSVARLWNEALLAAIRRDTPRPTVHARNLYHVSAAMYDAWAIYDAHATTIFSHSRSPRSATRAVREKAISHAAYRVLSSRFAQSPGHVASQAAFDALMSELGHDPTDDRTQGQSPAAVGNRIAATILQGAYSDGANEAGNYADVSGYVPVNLPLIVETGGTGGMNDINAWQPLVVPGSSAPQVFLTPHWLEVLPFALDDPFEAIPEPPPRLGMAGDSQVRSDVLELIRFSSHLDPNDAAWINISPAVMGNSTLGFDDGIGHPINPATNLPYPDNLVLRGDWTRVLSEFWADGPLSSTPPGHWNEIANQASDHPEIVHRIGDSGPKVDRLEWDVKLYLALNGALHDAAIVTWGTKSIYDFARPISLIREMATRGQSTDPAMPSWDPMGLPLQPGLVEIVTYDSSQPGERHSHLATHIGEIAVKAWAGHPLDPDTQAGGSAWILGADWLPYQQANFVTPPFAGYTSGHSAFSRAAAEVLTHFTGDAYFPGGVGEFQVAMDSDFKLAFEYGPSQPLILQWATYRDAADEAGLSRRYGGIHPALDDYPGRVIGHQVGIQAMERALTLFGRH
jgi:hypothetical protein